MTATEPEADAEAEADSGADSDADADASADAEEHDESDWVSEEPEVEIHKERRESGGGRCGDARCAVAR